MLEREPGNARIVTGTMFGILVGAIMLIGNAIAVRPATAQEVQETWFERKVVVEQLAERYAETPVELGITSEGAVLELFITPGGATWTMVVTLPNGLSHVVATGESWIKRLQLVKGPMS